MSELYVSVEGAGARAIDQSVTIDAFSRVVLEAEMNGYYDYLPFGQEGGSSFPLPLEPKLFPEDSVLRTRRPSGGLPKLTLGPSSTKTSSNNVQDLPFEYPDESGRRIWYRTASEDAAYKYFRTFARSSDQEVSGRYLFDEPQVFSVKYDAPISTNKIVIGFEYANALPNEINLSLKSSGDVIFNQTLQPDNQGMVKIYYDTLWSEEESFSYSFETIDEISFSIDSMNQPESAVDLIQVSPRIQVDISDRVIATSVVKTSQEVSLSNPIGSSSASSLSLQLSNNDGLFNNTNSASPFFGILDVNVKFTVDDIIGSDGEFELFPQGVFFSDSWNISSDGAVSVECLDRSKFLQSRESERSFYKNKSVIFVISDMLERAEITDYKILYAEEDAQEASEFYFFNNEVTVWQALQQISTAEQAIFYFDENDVFVWKSRDYPWQSEEINHVLSAKNTSNKLANLIDLQQSFTTTANKANVVYTPTKISKRGDVFVNNFLWEQSESSVLVASPLLNKIDELSQYIIIREDDYVLFPDEGVVNIDAEHIRYNKKPGKDVKLSVRKAPIEAILSEYLQDVIVAVEDASDEYGVPAEDIKIIYIEEILWDNPEWAGEGEDNPDSAPGYFLILRAGDKFLQYNALISTLPVLYAEADVDDTTQDLPHWKLQEGQVVFTEGEGWLMLPNALYITERGVFNSSPANHSFASNEDYLTLTFEASPPQIQSPQNLSKARHYFEDSNLKIRTSFIDTDLIYHYYPINEPSRFDVYGAEIKFPSVFDPERGPLYEADGLAGIFINQDGPGTGYYIELITSEYATFVETNSAELRIWKYNQDGTRRFIGGFYPEDVLSLTVEDLLEIAGADLTVFPDRSYKMAVYSEEVEVGSSRAVKITVVIDGRRVLSVIDREIIYDGEFDGEMDGEDFIEPNEIYTEGRWGVFARSHTHVDFEYVYAISGGAYGNTEESLSVDELSKAQLAVRDQIRGGWVDNTLENALTNFNLLRNFFFFDDFGSWVREVKEFDVVHEIFPSISSNLFIANESNVYVIYYRADQFGSKFALGNRTRRTVVLSGDDPSQSFNMTLAVYGVPLLQSEQEEVKKSDDKSVWRRGEEEIFVDSQWVQTKTKAERIADWVVERWGKPVETVSVTTILDPRIKLGDVVAVDLEDFGFSPEDQKFHVFGIERSIGSDRSMVLSLRRAHY